LPTNTLRIADAKRGDIGNTSTMYAKAFFEAMDFDAITVSPYMGEDSIRPFLEFENKWVICLALTSNAGHSDFQLTEENGKRLYEKVIETVCKWGSEEQLMFVVGATRAEKVAEIRRIIPNHFLLVPGVGAQGGRWPKRRRGVISKRI
jgi:orotidine-5'-phosphate decarboxylase